MTDWQTLIDDRQRQIDRNGAARAPATWGEAWEAQWTSSGLDTLFGVGKPFNDAYGELTERLGAITGKAADQHFADAGVVPQMLGADGRIEALGRIVDALPDPQQKLLADYKDVRGRARQKAAEIEREAADVAGASYGLGANASAFLAGVARQVVDPFNLATIPIGPARVAGGGLKATGLFLAKEAATGAAVQAVQEPFINVGRQELGLETSSFENIMEAGLGQAALSGLFLAAGAALRRLRAEGKPLPPGAEELASQDFEAAARKMQSDAAIERMAGDPIKGAEAIEQARHAMETGAPIAAMPAARAAQFDLARPREIRVNDDLAITVQYEVADLAQLKISHGLDGAQNPAFPALLQPRDRSEAASLQWVRENAARLDPEQLGTASTAQLGAPIVAADGVVESGNGRALLVAMAYREFPERAAAYRAYLDELGFDVDGIEQPVLVRRRTSELAAEERIAFTREANVTTTAALAPDARAKVDAGKIDDGLMSLWAGKTNVDTLANARFVREFAGRAVARTELPEFMRADGTLTEAGARRIEAALMARAWRADDLIAKVADDPSGTSKSIVDALIDTAPVAARLRAAVEEGRVSREMDLISDVTAAFRLVERARTSGQKLSVLVDQVDIERGAVSDGVRDAVRMFFRDDDYTIAASAEVVAERLRFAIDNALMRQEADLFGETTTKAGLMRAAVVADEPIGDVQLTGLERAKAMTEARQKADEQARGPARLPPEIAAAEQRLSAAMGELDPEMKMFDLGLTDAQGQAITRSAREGLDDIKARAQAAAELQDCVMRTGANLA